VSATTGRDCAGSSQAIDRAGDEPTGNLDTRTSIEVMHLPGLNQERGITILLITHERDIAEYSTRIITCRDGLVVSDRPVDQRRFAEDELKTLPQESVA